MEKIIETIPNERVSGYDVIQKYFEGKKVCMFDIETTGLSPMSSFTYIIGINVIVDGQWQIIQLFNDDGRSEPELIREFQQIIKDYDVLLEFNGDRFDIPYIEKRMGIIEQKFHISLTNNFPKIMNYDLMKCIKPYKFALGLPNIKQKTIERYLGINRVDMYNGGELINVYLDYLATGNVRNRDLVLRHNRDDMEGMVFLGAVLSIESLSRKCTGIENVRTYKKGDKLMLEIKSLPCFPIVTEISTSAYGASFQVEGASATLTVPIEIQKLRYYYTEREKDGYEEKEGFFVSSLSGYVKNLPVYKENARSKTCYYLLNDDFLGNQECLKDYCLATIGHIMTYKGR